MLEITALTLAGVHLAIPLAYYYYAKTRWLKKPWDIRFNEDYRPKVSIVVPTYNEAKLIQRRLDNIHEQDYPRSLMEVMVVDSSNDGTPTVIEKWAGEHPDFNIRIIREAVRRGKLHALNTALKQVDHASEIVIIADADALWPRDAVRETVKWLSDRLVSAVSCLKEPAESRGIESSYRHYYNTLRVAESKAYATPIFHGELAAFRMDALRSIGGFREHVGADDSHAATRIAMLGSRAVVAEKPLVRELVPNGPDYHKWRMRRAQHLVQHFLRSLREHSRAPTVFNAILGMEAYLHLVNPWLLASSVSILVLGAFSRSLASAIALALGACLLTLRPFRTWVITQLYLVLACIRNLYGKEIAWPKQAK